MPPTASASWHLCVLSLNTASASWAPGSSPINKLSRNSFEHLTQSGALMGRSKPGYYLWIIPLSGVIDSSSSVHHVRFIRRCTRAHIHCMLLSLHNRQADSTHQHNRCLQSVPFLYGTRGDKCYSAYWGRERAERVRNNSWNDLRPRLHIFTTPNTTTTLVGGDGQQKWFTWFSVEY